MPQKQLNFLCRCIIIYNNLTNISHLKIIGNKLTEAIKSLSSVCSFCFTPMPAWKLRINHRPESASSTEKDSPRGSLALSEQAQHRQASRWQHSGRSSDAPADWRRTSFFLFSPEADGFRLLLTQDLTGEKLPELMNERRTFYWGYLWMLVVSSIFWILKEVRTLSL